MSFNLIGGGSDLPTAINSMNTNILQLKNDELTKIFKDDQGTPVVILNKDGLKTTAPGSGVDVTTATNDQLTSNSNQDQFKILATGEDTIGGIAVAPSPGTASFSSRTIQTGIFGTKVYLYELYGVDPATNQYYPFPIIATRSGPGTVYGGLIADQYFSYGFTAGGQFLIFVQGANYNNATLPALNLRWYVKQESAA
jgi:hypothetical protein